MRNGRLVVLTQCIPDAVVQVVECLPQLPRLPLLPEQTDPMQSLAQPPAQMFVELAGQVPALEEGEESDQSGSVPLGEWIRDRVG